MRPPESIITELLKTRGISTQEDINSFLFPKLTSLPSPKDMLGMDAAVEQVVDAIKGELPILIWGDYDVDGTTATSLLVNFFKALGVDNIHYHIPNRLSEGYGLSLEYFKNIPFPIENGFLLITVDCGISNHKEIEEIKKMGAKVVVTDHHQLPSKLPECIILNPSNPQCNFSKTCLAGVGVAFYLAFGIRNFLISGEFKTKVDVKKLNLKSFLAFVALGTLADVVKLTPANRLMVKAGIESIKETPFHGLKYLTESCEIYNGKLFSSDIGFNLAPKINAAGRFGVGHLVVDLLTTVDESLAKKITTKLTKLNIKRKQQCKDAITEILDNLIPENVKTDRCIVHLGDYHEGIIGIVASRLVDQFQVPTIIFTQTSDNLIKGSARSIKGINIHSFLTNNSFLLQKFGGHEMAAGMSMNVKNFEALRENLISYFLENDFPKPRKSLYDLESSTEEIFHPEFIKLYNAVEPFGEGNKQPVFYDKQAEIISARQVGTHGQHLQLTIRSKFSDNVKGVGFNLGSKIKLAEPGAYVKISFSPTINRYKNSSSWQAQILDIF